MKKYFSLLLAGSLALTSAFGQKKQPDFAKYVNPFIGNADNGHTFPGACAPFGMIQAGPESGNGSWRYCSGYNDEDDTIFGFAQDHLNGTGCPDLGDILLFPFSGLPDKGPYRSRIDKSGQQAVPGYYAVRMTDAGVDAEITATGRTAMYRFRYDRPGEARLLLDLQSGLVADSGAIRERVLRAGMQWPDNRTITGHNEVRGWVQRQFFYVIRFDKPYTIVDTLLPAKGEQAKRLVLAFDLKPGETLQTKVAISAVSVEGAMAAIERENPGWDFNRIRQQTYAQWNGLLARIAVKGTKEQQINFYTSLYHLCIQPNNMADVDGRYRGADDSVHSSASGEYYSTLSLWDTYRAAHPLYTLLTPERVNGFIQTMLAHHRAQGYLPVWTLWGKENHCMIGNHAIPVIVDAFLKGFDGFDKEAAYQAVRESATRDHFNTDWTSYDRYGYFPFDIVKAESVSKTLEAAYDNYCVAQMAKAMGKETDHHFFSQRAGYYKNLFDPVTKFMRGRDAAGHWRSPFRPLGLFHAGEEGGDYTEGNAWQYTWSVQHDTEGLVSLMGGPKAFADRLDSLFVLEADTGETGVVHDVSGLIGQYAHGNEPSHHIIYQYAYTDRPWRTQELVREVMDAFYQPRPNGLCGNDDCGQMSAWYIFSAMGFYPLNPCGGAYVIGAPQLKEAAIRLPGKKIFRVKAINLSAANKYVRSVRLNGKPLQGFLLSHADILQGGTLEFVMGNTIPGRTE